jgi:hypothetical protein
MSTSNARTIHTQGGTPEPDADEAGDELEVAVSVGLLTVGDSVVGASVVGAWVVGTVVVGASVVGASVVGASVVGASVVGASVVGASVDGGRETDGRVGGGREMDGSVVGAPLWVGRFDKLEAALASASPPLPEQAAVAVIRTAAIASIDRRRMLRARSSGQRSFAAMSAVSLAPDRFAANETPFLPIASPCRSRPRRPAGCRQAKGPASSEV